MRSGGAYQGRERDSGAGADGPRQAERPWSAIVLAGNRAEGDPLAAHFGAPMKALVRIGGEPMIAHVLRTLLQSPSIGRILIITQQPELLKDGALEWIAGEPRIACTMSRGGIAESLNHEVGTKEAPWPVLITTADHPLLTTEIVEYFIRESSMSDASIGVVERGVLLERYPQNRRTWLRFGGGAYTGANLFAVRTDCAAGGLKILASVESDRKRQLKLLWRFGPLLALGAATRTLSIQETVERGGRRLGIKVIAVAIPFAEAGIDVDRPEDHRLAGRIMAGRNGTDHAPAAARAVSIFDLDRTLTRRGTYTAFLLYAAWRRAPWRLLTAPAAAFLISVHVCGGLSRKGLKEKLQRLFLGARAERHDVARLAAAYARRRRAAGFNCQGISQIEEERSRGRGILLATAANALYVEEMARSLGIEEIMCAPSFWAAAI